MAETLYSTYINYYATYKENDQLLVLNEINQSIDELDTEQNTQITADLDHS